MNSFFSRVNLFNSYLLHVVRAIIILWHIFFLLINNDFRLKKAIVVTAFNYFHIVVLTPNNPPHPVIIIFFPDIVHRGVWTWGGCPGSMTPFFPKCFLWLDSFSFIKMLLVEVMYFPYAIFFFFLKLHFHDTKWKRLPFKFIWTKTYWL